MPHHGPKSIKSQPPGNSLSVSGELLKGAKEAEIKADKTEVRLGQVGGRTVDVPGQNDSKYPDNDICLDEWNFIEHNSAEIHAGADASRVSVLGKKSAQTAPAKVGGNKLFSMARLSHLWERLVQIFTFSSQSFSVPGSLAKMFFREIHFDKVDPKNKLGDWASYSQKGIIFRSYVDGKENDRILIAKLGSAVAAVPTHTDEKLFPADRPSIQDIQQGHGRHDCYFLSAIAGVLARSTGVPDIMNIMRDNGDNTVTVRFSDCEVAVTKDRLVDKAGNDMYSTGAPWVRILEKAFHVRLVNMEYDPHAGRMDRRAGIDGLSPFTHLMEGLARSESKRMGEVSRTLDMAANAEAIKEVLKQNGVVTVGSSPTNRPGKVLKSVVQGLMPGHQYSVIGLTDVKGKEAFVIYNPYGGPLNNVENSEDNLSPVRLRGMGRGSALFAVPVEELGSYFSEAALLQPAAKV